MAGKINKPGAVRALIAAFALSAACFLAGAPAPAFAAAPESAYAKQQQDALAAAHARKRAQMEAAPGYVQPLEGGEAAVEPPAIGQVVGRWRTHYEGNPDRTWEMRFFPDGTYTFAPDASDEGKWTQSGETVILIGGGGRGRREGTIKGDNMVIDNYSDRLGDMIFVRIGD